MLFIQKYGIYIIGVVLLCAIAFAQVVYDRHKPDVPAQAPKTLPASILSSATLGLRSAAASLLWLQLIQNLGYVYGSAEDIHSYIDTITTLDPQFSYPYAFGILMMPSTAENAERAIALGKVGLERNLHDWRIPYYMGTLYHLVLDDKKNAALYFAQAAHTPGVPEKVALFAKTYRQSGSGREQTKGIWQSIHDSSADEVVRAQAQDALQHIAVMELLEQSIVIYRRTYGTYPSRIEELVEKKILRALPEDPFNIRYRVGPDGQLTFEL